MKKWALTIGLFSILSLAVNAGSPKVEMLSRTFVNFETHPLKSAKKRVLKVRNSGNETLKFGRIFKSCSCATTHLGKKTLDPGEMTDITIAFIPYSIEGKYRKMVSIETNDPNQRFIKITIVGTSEPLVKVIPDDKFYPRYMKIGKAWEQLFSLQTMQDGVKLGAPQVTSNYPTELKKLSEKPYKKGTLTHYELTITPEKSGTDLDCKVSFQVLSPEGWKPVVVTVKSRVGLRLYAFPRNVHFKLDKPTPTREFQLRFLGDNSQKIDTTKIKWNELPGMSLTLGKQKGIVIPVTATFEPEFFKKLKAKKKLKVAFEYPESNPTVITFMVE